jgi:hypothetical protein
MSLHEFAEERVALLKWPAGEHSQSHAHAGRDFRIVG